MRLDDHFRPEDCGGLHDSIHDIGHKYIIREAREKKTTTILVFEPTVVQRMDVYRHGVLRRVLILIHVGQVKNNRNNTAKG